MNIEIGDLVVFTGKGRHAHFAEDKFIRGKIYEVIGRLKSTTMCGYFLYFEHPFGGFYQDSFRLYQSNPNDLYREIPEIAAVRAAYNERKVNA